MSIENITAGTGTMLKAEFDPYATASVSSAGGKSILNISTSSIHTNDSYDLTVTLFGETAWNG